MKKIIWVGSSYNDLKDFPFSVRNAVGYVLYFAQKGMRHQHMKVLSGMGNASLLEIKENDISGTYRLIYTIEFENYIFVLHAFQKKSKSGISTPKTEIDIVKRRLKEAKTLYKEIKKGVGK